MRQHPKGSAANKREPTLKLFIKLKRTSFESFLQSLGPSFRLQRSKGAPTSSTSLQTVSLLLLACPDVSWRILASPESSRRHHTAPYGNQRLQPASFGVARSKAKQNGHSRIIPWRRCSGRCHLRSHALESCTLTATDCTAVWLHSIANIASGAPKIEKRRKVDQHLFDDGFFFVVENRFL